MRWKPEQLANNRTTTNQQKNQHSHGPEEKNNISMKGKKKDNISRRRTAPFLSISTTKRCRNERKKASKRLGWSRHLSLSFFCVPTLSLFTFPRTTTKNIENSVDPRWGTRSTVSPLKMISILVERVYRLLYLIFVIYLSPEIVMTIL